VNLSRFPCAGRRGSASGVDRALEGERLDPGEGRRGSVRASERDRESQGRAGYVSQQWRRKQR
jgi:hypothetical protein